MDEKETLEVLFFQWLAARVSPAQLSELYQYSAKIDQFCLPRGLLKKPMFQTDDPAVLTRALTELDRSRSFLRVYRSGVALSALRHYIHFIQDRHPSPSPTAAAPKPPRIISPTAENAGAAAPKAPTEAGVPSRPMQAETDALLTVDFSKSTDYSHTTPAVLYYHDKPYPVGSWEQVYMTLLACLAADFPERFRKLVGRTLKGSLQVMVGVEGHLSVMKHAKKIEGTSFYAETNFRTNDLVKLLAMLLSAFHLNASNVIIKYAKDPLTTRPDVPPASDAPKRSPAVLPSRSVDEQRKAFTDWLIKNGSAPSSARVNASAIDISSQYAVVHSIGMVEFYAIGNAQEARQYAKTLLADAGFAESYRSTMTQLRAGLRKYCEYLQANPSCSILPVVPDDPAPAQPDADSRWKEILEKDFPDGYILNDFLSQFQAAATWQERFGAVCPIEGEAIDQAISACGTMKDGRVFARNDAEDELLMQIADAVATTLQTYSNVYASQVYQRYREALAALSIYTEKVMVQQVLLHAAGRFVFAYSYLFVKPGDSTLTEVDCARALRRHGGMMTTDEAADELWFIPRDKVSHYLSLNDEILSLGTGQWMLAEHFPFSRADAAQVARLFDERFLSQEYILSREIPELLKQQLPSVAENVAGLSFTALFNIIFYYLKDQYSFSRSIVAPAGTKFDFSMLFSSFAREHDTFSITDLNAYAKELNVPIYWESTLAGGSVRVSSDLFVNRRQLHFDVDAIDRALEAICSGDYLSLQAIPQGMLVLLPACGYQWNEYLLLSYVYGFSKAFRMIYNSLGKTGCYGAMVRRSCKAINSYETLVERVLTDDDSWVSPADALALLVRQGYQAQRRLNGIDSIAAKAKMNKLG